jgi:hypothetical protein
VLSARLRLELSECKVGPTLWGDSWVNQVVQGALEALVIWPCQHRPRQHPRRPLQQLHQRCHRPLLDQLCVAEIKSYNKRCTHYFVKFYLLTRIIYFPKSCILLLLRFTKDDDKNTPRLNHREEQRGVSSASQNHHEESAISFDC